MPFYKYQPNAEWLAERRKYITASDFISVYKLKNKPSDNAARDKFKLMWLDKHSNNHFDDDFNVTGAAARGHCLEYNAIEQVNADTLPFDETPYFYHWDNMIIRNGIAAWSPDACDIKQGEGLVCEAEPKHIIEVKCYENKHHFECYYTDKTKLPERLQVAWAMAVSDSIEDAAVFFYNPSSAFPYFDKKYTREELSEEIALAKHAISIYEQVDKEMTEFIKTFTPPLATEEQIYADLVNEWS